MFAWCFTQLQPPEWCIVFFLFVHFELVLGTFSAEVKTFPYLPVRMIILPTISSFSNYLLINLHSVHLTPFFSFFCLGVLICVGMPCRITIQRQKEWEWLQRTVAHRQIRPWLKNPFTHTRHLSTHTHSCRFHLPSAPPCQTTLSDDLCTRWSFI